MCHCWPTRLLFHLEVADSSAMLEEQKTQDAQKRSRAPIDVLPQNIACRALLRFLPQLESLPVSLVTERQSMVAQAAAIRQTLRVLIH